MSAPMRKPEAPNFDSKIEVQQPNTMSRNSFISNGCSPISSFVMDSHLIEGFPSYGEVIVSGTHAFWQDLRPPLGERLDPASGQQNATQCRVVKKRSLRRNSRPNYQFAAARYIADLRLGHASNPRVRAKRGTIEKYRPQCRFSNRPDGGYRRV